MRWATPAIRAAGDAEAADSEAPESGRGGLRPAWQGLLAFAVYFGVFILAFGMALISRMGTPSVGQGEVDPNFYIWAWRWWTYAVSHWTNPLYSYQIGAPAGYNLAWATTSPPVALLMWPITATLGPVLSFNLTLLLAPPASAWAAFVLTRRLTRRFWAALPAGAIYGFNVYMLDHSVSGQPNLTVTLLLPLIAYLIVLWWEGALGRTGFMIWMTVAIALEFYVFIEAYAEMTLLFVLGLLLGLALAGSALRPKVLRLAGYTAIAYVGALVLSVPYLVYALQNNPTELTRQLPHFSLDLSSLVLPRSDRLLGMDWWRAAAGHDLMSINYVGVPLLLLFLLLVITGWSNRVVRLLAIGFVVIIALALGPNMIVDGQQVVPLPWGKMWGLPFFRSAEPIRLMIFGYLVLSIVFALWIATLTKSKLVQAARWGLATVALAAIFADLPTFASVVAVQAPKTWKPANASVRPTNTMPRFFTDGAYRRYIKPGEIIVVISHRGNAGMMFQAYTNFYFRIDGGFINASLSRVDALPLPVALLSHTTKERVRGFEAYVRQTGIGAIIVERAWSEKWMKVFGKLGMKTTSVGGVTVYDTATMKEIG